MKYRCTECEVVHDTLARASHCHWGIGGVEDIEDTVIKVLE